MKYASACTECTECGKFKMSKCKGILVMDPRDCPWSSFHTRRKKHEKSRKI